MLDIKMKQNKKPWDFYANLYTNWHQIQNCDRQLKFKRKKKTNKFNKTKKKRLREKMEEKPIKFDM